MGSYKGTVEVDVRGKTAKVSFNTLQIIDDIGVPYGLEPITQDFPQFGSGGATQVITHSKIDLIINYPKNSGGR